MLAEKELANRYLSKMAKSISMGSGDNATAKREGDLWTHETHVSGLEKTINIKSKLKVSGFRTLVLYRKRDGGRVSHNTMKEEKRYERRAREICIVTAIGRVEMKIGDKEEGQEDHKFDTMLPMFCE